MAKLVCVDINGNRKDIITHEVNNGKNSFINIKHGMKEGWEVRFSLDRRMFIPGESVSFNSDSFIINPITKNNKEIKDSNGNVYHVISKNKLKEHKNDVIFLIDTLIKYDEVKITKDPTCYLIGKGINVLDGIKYIAPVFEVYEKGNIVLEDNDNKLTISFKDGNFKLIKG